MNKEIQSITGSFRDILNGEPWFGRAMYPILDEIDPAVVYKKPNENSHSLIELLYHSLTWATFTLKCLEQAGKEVIAAIKKTDWREIDPSLHTWKQGLETFQSVHEKIIQLLNNQDDHFLDQIVSNHKFSFRILLNGLIQHNVYHLGQIAYVKKLLQ